MPQKKNPDLLEYLRGKSGSTLWKFIFNVNNSKRITSFIFQRSSR